MLSRCVSRVSVLVVLLVAAAGISWAQDSWNGGTGNWSNPANWSAGLPGSASDVAIHSGGNDLVYLDMSPNINSLTLGNNILPWTFSR